MMKIKKKSLGITIGISVSILLIISTLMKDATTPTYSVSEENITKTIPQNNALADISSCSQTKEINDSYRTCIISNSDTSGISNLPSPVFKYVTPLFSNYGPGPAYSILEPKNLLSQEQMERVIDIIRNDPEVKSQSFSWKVHYMEFYPFRYSWYDRVDLVIYGIKEIGSPDCGWKAAVTIDLNTLTIIHRENMDVVSYDKC